MNPFLVGTVAIGGIADMMPVFFVPFRRPSRSDVVHFRASIIAGVAACYLLNVVWSRAVLGIVPQTDADAVADGMTVSLEAAGAAGDIATKPVIRVIDDRYPQYAWVATTVTAFITLSITVSFNAVGLGVKHVLDGMALTTLRFLHARLNIPAAEVAAIAEVTELGGDASHGVGESGSLASTLAAINPIAAARRFAKLVALRGGRVVLGTRAALYVACFGAVLGIALADPSGFIMVLEVFTSMALNMAGGVFVVLMYVGVRSPPPGSLHRKAMMSTVASGDPANLRGYAGASREALEAAGVLPRGGSSDADGSAADPAGACVVLPLPEAVGATAATFCLATFALAVVYDVYSAGVNKGAYDPATGAWVAVAAVALLWRFAFVPLLVLLWRISACRPSTSSVGRRLFTDDRRQSGESVDVTDEGGYGTVGLLQPSRRITDNLRDERADLLRSTHTSLSESMIHTSGASAVAGAQQHASAAGGAVPAVSLRDEDGADSLGRHHGHNATLVRRIVDRAFSAALCEVLAEVATSLAAAWDTFTLRNGDKNATPTIDAYRPLLTALAAALIVWHMIIFTPLAFHCRSRSMSTQRVLLIFSAIVDGVVAVALGAGYSLAGHAGPAVVQFSAGIYVVAGAVYRTSMRTGRAHV